MARLTQMNHLLSVQPALALWILREESVPELELDLENRACSALPHMY